MPCGKIVQERAMLRMRRLPLAGPFLLYLLAAVLCAADFTGDTDKDKARIAARRNW